MRNLLQLQKIDLKIEALRQRETEIPKQKGKYATQRQRLEKELQQSEQRLKTLALEQREAEGDIAAKQAQIKKYEGQLLAVKKNEEYQALLHEIDGLKKQIGQKEERIIGVMMELDDAREHLAEDKKRIAVELAGIDKECKLIDDELAEAVAERHALEGQRAPLLQDIDPTLLSRYNRIRAAKKTGPAVVPLNDEFCSGCHMKVTAQVVNEILLRDTEREAPTDKLHTCHHCGRLLYDPAGAVAAARAEVLEEKG